MHRRSAATKCRVREGRLTSDPAAPALGCFRPLDAPIGSRARRRLGLRLALSLAAIARDVGTPCYVCSGADPGRYARLTAALSAAARRPLRVQGQLDHSPGAPDPGPRRQRRLQFQVAARSRVPQGRPPRTRSSSPASARGPARSPEAVALGLKASTPPDRAASWSASSLIDPPGPRTAWRCG
jgi:hypothetical protein